MHGSQERRRIKDKSSPADEWGGGGRRRGQQNHLVSTAQLTMLTD